MRATSWVPPASSSPARASACSSAATWAGGQTTDIPAALAAALRPVLTAGGVAVIPAFAVERAQELIFHLGGLIRSGTLPRVPVVLDSPMAQKLLAVYRTHPEATEDGFDPASLDFPGLVLTNGQEDSKALNDRRGPFIVIAGSGMCTGGRIKHHLAHRIEDPKNLVLFVGYQAEGTLGRQILDRHPRVRLFGVERTVRAQVARVTGFSGHADRDELLAWLRAAAAPGTTPMPRLVVVIHGTPPVAGAFARMVTEATGLPAIAPGAGQAVPVP
jgi:metallo-beta-lactamase family protein